MAQSCGQNGTQANNEIEYLEMADSVPPASDSQGGIYFTPGDGDRQNLQSGVPAVAQDPDVSIYDLVGSSGVYTIHGRDKSNREKQSKDNKKNGGRKKATKFQITAAVMILIICLSSLGLMVFTTYVSKFHFKTLL